MRKILVAASAAAMLIMSSVSAFAAEANGQIAAVDPEARTVTLADGTTYEFATSDDVATLQVGQDVTITYDEGSDGKMMATEVKPAS